MGCGACELKALGHKAMAACNRGDYGQAPGILGEARTRAMSRNLSLHEAGILNSIGLVMQLAGQDADAKRMFSQALDRVRQRIAQDNPLHARIWRNLERAGQCHVLQLNRYK